MVWPLTLRLFFFLNKKNYVLLSTIFLEQYLMIVISLSIEPVISIIIHVLPVYLFNMLLNVIIYHLYQQGCLEEDCIKQGSPFNFWEGPFFKKRELKFLWCGGDLGQWPGRGMDTNISKLRFSFFAQLQSITENPQTISCNRWLGYLHNPSYSRVSRYVNAVHKKSLAPPQAPGRVSQGSVVKRWAVGCRSYPTISCFVVLS